MTLLIIFLCFPITGSTQQKSDKNSFTKDISLSHVDGNTTLNLDFSKHLDLTGAEVKKLADSLSIGVLEKTPAISEGVTIEILQPIDTNFHANALVIREIKTYPEKDMDVRIKIKEKEWLNSKELSKESILEPDKDKTPIQADIIGPKQTVLVKILNTTKSRISLKNWQIRFTYKTATGAANPRVIDRMSNAIEDVWRRVKQPKLVEPLIDSYSVTLSRKIDFKLLNDPTKTRNEQLSAISDGTRQIGWAMKKSSNFPQWIEIHDITGQLKHLDEPYILLVPNENVIIEDLPKVDTRIIITPRKQNNENQPPTDDR